MKKVKILFPLIAVLAAFLTTANVVATASDSELLRPTPNQTPRVEPTRDGGKEKKDKQDYKGTIAAVDAGSLTLTLKDGSSLAFILTADTKVNISGRSRSATIADLKVGDEATVQATKDESGALVATKVDVKSAKPVLDHYTGTVTDYQAGVSITIQEKGGTSRTFLITSETKIKFDPKDKAQTLEIGSEVTIVAERDASGGTPTAKEIVVKKQKAEKPESYKGTIAAVDTGSLTLTLKDGSSLAFILTADTKINISGRSHGATVADLKVGDEATVQATKDESGALVASKIDVKSAKPVLDHYTGTVTDYKAGVSITIQEKGGTSRTFLITSETKIKFDRKDKAQTLEVGSEVTIVAERDASGETPTAREIVVKKQKAEKPKNYKGTIAAVDAGSLTLTLKDGSSLVFILNAETKIKVTGLGKDAAIADLKVGDSATVRAKKDDSGALVAIQVDVKIKVQHYTGTVTDYQPGASITIQQKDGTSLTFLITADTKIKVGPKDEGNTLEVGSEVTVVAPVDPAGGTPTAKEIALHPVKKNFKGTIAAVDAASLTLTLKDGSSLVFVLTADTIVKIPELGREATVADLKVGDNVIVHASKDDTGALVADKINLIPAKPVLDHFTGTVTDYQAGVSITIQDKAGISQTFLITSDTKIKFGPKEEGSPLEIGSKVTIVSLRDTSGGTLTAKEIVVHPTEKDETATPTVTATPTETPTSEPVLEATATETETAISEP